MQHVFVACQVDVVNKQLVSGKFIENCLQGTSSLLHLTDCKAEILLKNNFFTSISQGFSKTCIPAPCIWNSKKPNNRSLWIFYHHLYITHLPLRFQILGAPFF